MTSSSSAIVTKDYFLSDAPLVERTRRFLPTVCQIISKDPSGKEGSGTGFVTQEGIVVTAYHVLNTDNIDHSAAYFLYNRSESPHGPVFKVKFLSGGFLYGSPTPKVGEFFGKNRLDFAIALLEESPQLSKITQFAQSFFALGSCPQLDSKVVIIQHPSKEEDPQTKMRGVKKETKGSITTVSSLTIHHKTETAIGSSGAPIVSRDNVVAIHLMGAKSCKLHPEAKTGVRMDAIMKSIPQEIVAKIRARANTSSTLDILREKYFNHETITLLLSRIQLPIKDLYVRLAIITDREKEEKSKQVKDGKPGEIVDRRIPTHETFFQPKEPVNLEQMFDTLKEKQKKRVIVFGSAGIGKSTFCLHVVDRMINGDLWAEHFKVVFLIRLRDLNERIYLPKVGGYTARELVQIVLGIDVESKDVNLSQTLLLLDGWDELPDAADRDGYLSSALEELMRLCPHVLMTSRPQSIPSESLYTKFEILGFDEQGITRYIDQFFQYVGSTTDKANLQNYLARFPLMSSLAHIPIILEVICSLIHEDSDTFKEMTSPTVSFLYGKMTDWLYRRFLLRPGVTRDSSSKVYKRKVVGSHKEVKNLTQALSELAWQAMVDNRLYLQQEDVEEIFDLDATDLENLGLVRFEGGMGYFIHLTFQEYYAGMYLASLYKSGEREKAQALVAGYKFYPRFTLVFSMAAGYLSLHNRNQVLQAYFDDLLAEPYDLAVTHETSLFASCFEECQDPSQIRQWKSFGTVAAAYINTMQFQAHNIRLLRRGSKLLRQEKVVDALAKGCSSSSPGRFFEIIREIAQAGQVIPLKIVRTLMCMVCITVAKRDEDISNLAGAALGEVIKTGARTGDHALAIHAFFETLYDPEIDYYFHGDEIFALGEVAKARNIIGEEWSRKALQVLFSVLDNTLSYKLRKRAASALIGFMKAGFALENEAVRKILTHLLDLVDIELCGPNSACSSLGQIVKLGTILEQDVTEIALQALLNMLPMLPNYNYASVPFALKGVVETEGSIGKEAAKKILPILLNVLCDSNQGLGVSLTPLLVVVLRRGDKTRREFSRRSIQALFSPLSQSDDNIPKEVISAVKEVVKIGIIAGEEILREIEETFFDRLSDSQVHYRIRGKVVFILGDVAKAEAMSGRGVSKKIMQTLLHTLGDSEAHYYSRKMAAISLGKIVENGDIVEKATSKKIVQALLSTLNDSRVHYYVQGSAATALGGVIKAGEVEEEQTVDKILQSLIFILRASCLSNHTRGKSASALKDIASANIHNKKKTPKGLLPIIPALLELIRNSEAGSYVRGETASILGEIVKTGKISRLKISKEIMPALQSVFCDSEAGDYARVKTAFALAEVAKNEKASGKEDVKKAITALLDMLCDSEASDNVKGESVCALGEVAKAGIVIEEEISKVEDFIKSCTDSSEGPYDVEYKSKSALGEIVKAGIRNKMGGEIAKKALPIFLTAILDPQTWHYFFRGNPIRTIGNTQPRVTLPDLSIVQSPQLIALLNEDPLSYSLVVKTCFLTGRAISCSGGRITIVDEHGKYSFKTDLDLKANLITEISGIDLISWRN